MSKREPSQQRTESASWWTLLNATLIGGACGGVVGLTLGGVTAVLAQLASGILTVSLGAAAAGGGIGGIIGFLAGLTLILDSKR